MKTPEPSETRKRHCPFCGSEATTPTGVVKVQNGQAWVERECKDCGERFMFVRRPLF